MQVCMCICVCAIFSGLTGSSLAATHWTAVAQHAVIPDSTQPKKNKKVKAAAALAAAEETSHSLAV